MEENITDQEIAEIRMLTTKFEIGFNSKDLGKMMELYADKYFDVNMKDQMQTREERASYYEKILNANKYKLKVNPDEIIVSGDHAFSRGEIELKDNQNGEIRYLRYIEVWRKENQKWKSIWGIDAPIHE